ncbi:hypothetical protein BC830DRAFT_1166071 [Chytriomyces sp. MP71]|nr:hypothetical protein BC830DRAFT_1166071 [Chytriomyces sp. MP71]
MVLIEGIPWKWFAKRRVVESVPGYDGPRYCKKEEDENEEYACISHVWGEVQPTNPIKATFIRDVAKDTFEYPTWLDVYSINQSSEDDKQSQMTVMADIYSKSTRCFIILESEGVYKSLLFEWYKPTVAIIRASIPTTDRRMAKHWDPSDSDILDDLHWVWGWHPRVMISVGSQFDFSLIREKAYDAVERLDMERSASDMVFKTPDFLKVFYMLSSFADQLAIFRNGQGWRHLHEAYENDDYNSRVWTFQERLLSKHKTYVSAYPEAEDYISVLIFHIPPNDVNQTLADYEVPEDRRKKVAENHTNGLTRILMHKSGYVGPLEMETLEVTEVE